MTISLVVIIVELTQVYISLLLLPPPSFFALLPFSPSFMYLTFPLFMFCFFFPGDSISAADHIKCHDKQMGRRRLHRGI